MSAVRQALTCPDGILCKLSSNWQFGYTVLSRRSQNLTSVDLGYPCPEGTYQKPRQVFLFETAMEGQHI